MEEGVKLLSYVNRTLIVVIVQAYSTRIRGTTTIVKEASKSEFEESVKRFTVVQELVGFVGIRGLGVSQLVGIDGVEVAGVRGILYPRYVRSHLPTQSLLEVDVGEKRVALHFVRVLTQPTIRAHAQLQYQVHPFRR